MDDHTAPDAMLCWTYDVHNVHSMHDVHMLDHADHAMHASHFIYFTTFFRKIPKSEKRRKDLESAGDPWRLMRLPKSLVNFWHFFLANANVPGASENRDGFCKHSVAYHTYHTHIALRKLEDCVL